MYSLRLGVEKKLYQESALDAIQSKLSILFVGVIFGLSAAPFLLVIGRIIEIAGGRSDLLPADRDLS